MAVTLLGIDPGSRTAENNEGVRTYRETYKLQSDSPSDSAFTVGSTAGLPLIGSTYADDAAAYCNNLSVANPEPYAGWTVTASYTTARQINSTQPQNDEILYSCTSEIYQEPIFVDEAGNAIINSAGDYFIDPTPTREASHFIIQIKSNNLVIPAFVLSYQNAVNDASINVGGLTVGARLAKVQRIQVGERQLRNGTQYYPLTMELHVKNQGHRLQPLDCGFRQIVDGKLQQITNEGDGLEVTQPVPLDGAGAVIAVPTIANAVFGDFQIYEELDFSVLPGIT